MAAPLTFRITAKNDVTTLEEVFTPNQAHKVTIWNYLEFPNVRQAMNEIVNLSEEYHLNNYNIEINDKKV